MAEYCRYCAACTDRPLPLLIAGDQGYADMAREFLGKIEYLMEQGFAVRYVNSVNDEALRTLFTRAAALLATTHYEGFGLANP